MANQMAVLAYGKWQVATSAGGGELFKRALRNVQGLISFQSTSSFVTMAKSAVLALTIMLASLKTQAVALPFTGK